MGKGGHGGKQRDLCVALYHRLQTKRRVKLSEFAKELEISYDTAFRWAESFSLIMDLRIERGIAILGEAEPDRLSLSTAPHSWMSNRHLSCQPK